MKINIGLLAVLLPYSCTSPQVKQTSTTILTPTPAPIELNWHLNATELTKQCQNAQNKLQTEIDSIAKTEKPTLVNTLERTDRALTVFANQIQPLDFYRHVLNDAKLKDAAKKCYEDSEKLRLSLFSRMDLYTTFKKMSELDPPQNSEQKMLTDEYFHAFTENGLSLPEEKRKELFQLKEGLVQLESGFSQTLGDWDEKLHFTKKELLGLPADLLASLEKSTKKGKDYVLTLKYNHVFPVLKLVKDPLVRKAVNMTFLNRGGEKNSQRLKDALTLRLKIANILGYKNYAEYRTQYNMAKDPGKIMAFLGDLQSKLRSRTVQEMQTLLDLKRKDLKKPKIKTLDSWDVSYYENKLRQDKYALDDEEVRAYFPADTTIAKMLNTYQTILDVNFIPLAHEAVWHSDVKAFQVNDRASNKVVGKFFMDLYPRDGKYNHAANFGLISGYEKEDGSYQQPISAIVANFSQPSKDQPSLLTHKEVETLFHEFGHVMHHVLSRAKYGTFSGMGTKRDFVEAPSQMMENWVWQKSTLLSLSSHYKTNQKMPEQLIEKLLRTRSFDAGIFYTRQIFYASIDMAYHTLSSTDHLDVTKMYNDIFSQIRMLEPIKGTRPEASYDHIMNGYDAGYYGYLWSEVYAMDMFTKFEDQLLSTNIGREYRTTILEQGGSQDPMDLVSKFLGRLPNSTAFLNLLTELPSLARSK